MGLAVLRIAAIVLLCVAFIGSVGARASDIEQIEITYRSASPWSDDRETFRVSKRTDGQYELRGQLVEGARIGKDETTTYPAKIISSEMVDRLEPSVIAEPWTRERLIAHVVTPQRLHESAERIYDEKTQSCSPQARQLFMSRFLDQGHASKELADYFESNWTDDWPIANIAVKFRSGFVVYLSSAAQHATMLPWMIDSRPNWNIEISQSLTAILPETSRLRSRLAHEKLLEEVADGVLSNIRDQWEDLEMRCVHREVLSMIEPKFEVLRLYESGGGLVGYVRRPDMPQNFAVNLVLKKSDRGARLAEAKEFLEKIDHYITISLPFVRSHPETRFTLWYADGLSLDESEVRRGPDDDRLKAIVAPVFKACSLLREHDYWTGKVWVVLPTTEVHLWRDRPNPAHRRPGPGW